MKVRGYVMIAVGYRWGMLTIKQFFFKIYHHLFFDTCDKCGKYCHVGDLFLGVCQLCLFNIQRGVNDDVREVEHAKLVRAFKEALKSVKEEQ
jgi:hypothetical protein